MIIIHTGKHTKIAATYNAVLEPTNDEFGLILNCAVRYALGRMTYIPSSVIQYITPLLPNLNDKTINCFVSDLEQQQLDVDKGIATWGMDCDKQMWLEFLDLCKSEKRKRIDEST